MIRIQLNNEWMDTYLDEDIQLSWDGFRFQKQLRAGYTNDITIPKTEKNLRLLNAVGLLDSTTQLFGTKTTTCILQNGIRITPMLIQLAGVNATEISICLYEDIFPEYFKGKTLNELLPVDGITTIWPWKHSTKSKYPSVFCEYNYGMAYDSYKAQYHPSRPLSNILYSVSGQYTMPYPPQSWKLMATKKTVCPQNLVQVIEMNDSSMDGETFKLHGGQHVTNDLSMSETNEITFNRNHVFASIKIWILWEKKGTTTQNKNAFFNINGQRYWWLPISSGSNDANCEIINIPQYEFNEGDTISFSCPDTNKYKFVSIIAKVTYTSGGWYNYITQDDYNQELEYVGRDPELRIASSYDSTIPMDGNEHIFVVSDRLRVTFQTEDLSFAYFGYYCNLPEIKICDLWYSLQWLMGGKLSFDHQRIITLESAYEYETIDGNITEIRPKSDKIGQKNYIKFKGEDSNPTFTIPNEWLENEYTIHESIFTNTYNNNYNVGWLPQYSNPEYDEDFNYWTTDFNEIEGVAVFESNVNNKLLSISLQTFSFDLLNQCMEVSITTFSPHLRDKDIIYLDGRCFLVISGQSSLENQKTELICLLFPAKLNKIKDKVITGNIKYN